MTTGERRAMSVSVADGRVLEVVLAGPPDGLPLFSHHGTPGAADMYELLVEIGAERNLCHVTYSRPGYGGSDRNAKRTVADCVADVAAIADELGYDRFYTSGGSGGGPHAIACAALLPERVIAAAAVASPAPVDVEGLEWTAGMGKENQEEFAAARAGDRQLAEFLERNAAEMHGASGEQILAVLGDLVSEVDRRAVTPDLAEHISRDVAHALSDGIWGWFDDDRALMSDWGFDLAQVTAPLSLWHGAQDRFVPISHGEWLAEHVKAEVHLEPDEGHLSLTISSYGKILDALLVF